MKTPMRMLQLLIVDLMQDAKSEEEEAALYGVFNVIEGKLFEQEKQVIIESYKKGKTDFCQYDPERHGNEPPKAEQYYSNTFKE